jgi:hypothetical protein
LIRNSREGKPERASWRQKEDCMDAREIVEKLIVGSREIDRMRKEVDDFVKMVCGFIKKEMKFSFIDDINIEFSDDRCRWKVCMFGITKKEIEISCDVAFCGWKSGYSMLGHTTFSPRDVQQVYECLPVLIQAVLEKIPKISEEWDYLIKAAEK